MAGVRFEQDPTNFLDIEVLRRMFPGVASAWDGNRLIARITYTVQGASRSFETELWTDDFERFEEELSGEFYPNRLDDADLEKCLGDFDTLEGGVMVMLEVDDAGDVVAECTVAANRDIGPVDARFFLKLANEQIPELLRQVRVTIAEFPVVSDIGTNRT